MGFWRLESTSMGGGSVLSFENIDSKAASMSQLPSGSSWPGASGGYAVLFQFNDHFQPFRNRLLGVPGIYTYKYVYMYV